MALAEARALAGHGQTAAALRGLESFLARNAGLGQPDLAVLRLEAARLAADATPLRARTHLIEAERLLPAFRTVPELAARLQRELARVAERVGDLTRAEALLISAEPAMLASGDAAGAAEAANALGTLHLEFVRPGEAAADFRRSADLLATQGVTQGEAVTAALVNLANAHIEAGQLEAARAAAASARTAAGSDPALLRAADYARAQVLLREPDLPGAEAVLERLASAPEQDPVRGHALLLLATSRFDRGRTSEAVEAGFAALEAYRVALGERHPAFGRALHTLGSVHQELGDTRAAEGFYARAVEVQRAALGPNAIQVHATEIERAGLATREGDIAAAVRRATAALTAFRIAPPPDRRLEGLANVVLGLVAERQGRIDEAVRLFRRAQTIIELARGAYSPDLGFSLVRLGRMLTRAGRLPGAAAPLDQAISLYERVGATGTVRLAEAVTARAELRARSGDRRGALDDGRRALALLRGREGAFETGGDAQRRGARELFAVQARLLVEQAPGNPSVLDDAFAASQESLTSRAGDALRRASARLAAGTGELAMLLRARDEAADVLLQAGALAAAAAVRTGVEEAARLNGIRDEALQRLRSNSKLIEAQFPAYAGYLAPRPAQLRNVQAALRQDEALIAPVISDDGLLLWVVTAAEARALPLPHRRDEIAELVRRIRTGVDLSGVGPGKPLPFFDIDAAQALYGLILAPAEETGLLASVRQLVLVPDGALQSVPPHLLVGPGGSWLVQRYAVSIAPSIAAAVAAKEAAARPSGAEMAFLGVGNPQFGGFKAPATPNRRGLPAPLRQVLATLSALPETADELHRLAALFGEQRSTLVLGPEATERRVLDVQPGRFRTLAFATHALMAGEIAGLTEPAIVLTPGADEVPLEGLLTASDVAALELDADLVLLSACNTAAPDGGPYAEGMSGLARAFLQAGARSLLVSHWAVDSSATVLLTTGFIEAALAEPGRSRAEALRQAMLRLVNDKERNMQHPAFWAPFVLVGG